MNDEMQVLEVGSDVKIEDETENDTKLKENPLPPNPINTVEYIELLIEREMLEKRPGFSQRVKTLERCKERAAIGNTGNSLR